MSVQLEQNPFSQCQRFNTKKIHLGVSGSVACYKAIDLLRALKKIEIATSVTLTEGAKKFISPLLFKSLGATRVYDEMFEDCDVFAHLEPGRSADAMAIAPASANTLARIAGGFADEMLCAQALAFGGPILVAPAMNPRMWANAATRANIKTLRDRNFHIAQPETGLVADGDEGAGRLASVGNIFMEILKMLSPGDMRGLRALVTMGPTREYWDGVRFWSNPSSGLMGTSLATCAWLRGADVTAICGPGVNVFLPLGIHRVNVVSAREMRDEAVKLWPGMDIAMCSAAVADFAPVRPENADNLKVKKTESPETLNIEFHSNPDILLTLAGNRNDSQKVLGFAAEITPDMKSLLPLATLKLNRKKADIIAANRVNPGHGAFGSDTDSMLVIDRTGRNEIWSSQGKADIAWELCSWLLSL